MCPTTSYCKRYEISVSPDNILDVFVESEDVFHFLSSRDNVANVNKVVFSVTSTFQPVYSVTQYGPHGSGGAGATFITSGRLFSATTGFFAGYTS